jgi:hypothetical protein
MVDHMSAALKKDVEEVTRFHVEFSSHAVRQLVGALHPLLDSCINTRLLVVPLSAFLLELFGCERCWLL